MSTQPFFPCGPTVTFTANTIAPTPIQAYTGSPSMCQYRVVNTAAVTVFMGAGAPSGSTGALADAVVPLPGLPTGAIPLLAGTVEIFTLPANCYFTGITSSGTGAVYITPGDGS